MREIKFRAFYKGDTEEWESDGNARMIYDIQEAYDGIGFDDPEGGFGWVSCFSDFMAYEKMTVMQYTGLKDEDGTEIYEGDIVKCFTNGNSYVSFKGGVFGLIFDYTFIPFSDIHGGMKVIGNIYEHKPLLEREK